MIIICSKNNQNYNNNIMKFLHISIQIMHWHILKIINPIKVIIIQKWEIIHYNKRVVTLQIITSKLIKLINIMLILSLKVEELLIVIIIFLISISIKINRNKF